MTVHDIAAAVNKVAPEVDYPTVSFTARRLWRDYRGGDIPVERVEELVEAVLMEVKAKRDEDVRQRQKEEEDRKNGVVYVPTFPDAYKAGWNHVTPSHPDDALSRRDQSINVSNRVEKKAI